MPRALVVGNGRLHANLDGACRLRDLYYPYVGQESHAGEPNRLGFWTDGAFAWFDEFDVAVGYDGDSMVATATGANARLGLAVTMHIAVDFESDVLVRQIELHDLSGRDREVRVFVHTDLDIGGTDVGDTAFYDPELQAMIHYKGSRYFLVNGRSGRGSGVHQFTAGRAGFQGFAGSWADAEDGELSGHAIEQGAVDSCVGFVVNLGAGGGALVHTWMCVATAYRDVTALDELVRHATPQRLIERTRGYWNSWTDQAMGPVVQLPDRLRTLYARSLLVSRQLCDHDGGVLAATDRDILEHARDTYCYVWPRDGALVAQALARAGHGHPLRAFLRFCAERFGRSRGYLLHKFTPDGALGSSWHPWFDRDGPQTPIQQDETALVVWALGEYDARNRDREFLSELYRRVVEKAADWMASWRDWRTGLPLPSWDLWEERRGVHAFTVASVWGGLVAASTIARDLGDLDRATHWAACAAEVRRGADEHLFDPESGRFARSLVPRADQSGYDRDMTLDASAWGLFAFGMYAPDDPRIVATMEAVRSRLWVSGGIGGLARYERDYYQSVELSEGIPGNPWVICTLWLADWLSRTAKTVAELDINVLPLLEWVAEHASPAGLLPEQVHPRDGAPLSVQPLTWSHAAFVDSCLTYVQAREGLEAAAQVSSADGLSVDFAPTAPAPLEVIAEAG